MRKIKEGDADIIALDAGDIYEAGRYVYTCLLQLDVMTFSCGSWAVCVYRLIYVCV